MTENRGRLNNLYQVSEKIRIAMLGQDWEMQRKLKEVLEQVNNEIRKETNYVKST